MDKEGSPPPPPSWKTEIQGLFASPKQDLTQEIEAKFRVLDGPESNEDESSNGDEERTEVSPALTTCLANYLGDAPKSSFDNLAEEFSTTDKTSAPVNPKLATMIKELIKDNLPKAKLEQLVEKYPRPENCKLLVPPKVNRAIWNQLSPTLAGNRELNLRRRESLKPDLNAQFASLCNQTTPITSELFGDDLGKEIDETWQALFYEAFFRGKELLQQESRSKAIDIPLQQGDKPLNCNLQVGYTSSIDSIIRSGAPFKAGQLRNCLKEWQRITSEPFILQYVSNCELEFDYLPTPNCIPNSLHPESKFSLTEQEAIDAEINDFLVKQVIEQSQPETGEIVSPIFVRPKKEPGVYRVIFNLKSLNQAVTYHKFKMDTLESAVRLMKPGCFISSIDLHNAYYSIPISPSFRKYLKFAWRGSLFQFCALPMGLTSSPRIFTKVLKPVFATLRSQYGHNCLGYIDDSFYTEDSAEDCREATLHATQLFTRLGFVIHPTKSVFHPAQCLEFLGFLLDSTSMTVRLTPKKADKIVVLCRKALRAQELSIREVASLIGTLVSTFPGVEFGPLYYRQLEWDKDLALKSALGDFDVSMSLSADSINELEWWVISVPTAFRVIDHGCPNITLTTDASRIGWGATTHQSQTQALWSRAETEYHVNILELLSVKLSLMSLLGSVSNQHIRIMSDNMTAISYINAKGGCRNWECNAIAKAIWLWAIKRNNWLSAAHQPGRFNVTADSLSRHFEDGIEWELNRGLCLQKLVLEQATAIIIVPLWTTQTWFTNLLSLLVDVPRIFRVTKKVLSHPVRGDAYPLCPKLHLLACKVSGVSSLSATFRSRLPTCLCLLGDQPRENSVILTSADGEHLRYKRKLIHCIRV
ncbi:uncharacterized protein [Montipora capricornis]|uniref:uncharacterized protein n=1 Tax=Montipora capricornis TaxID=246305 RepID=UPI0035F10003